jgi:predicted O-linked N-acetylglucosamine transferase (SPINDLY family)
MAVRIARSGAYAAALPLLARAKAGRSVCPDLGFAAALSHFELGNVDAAIRELRRVARSKDPEVRRAALRRIAVCIPGAPGASNPQILKARRQWAGVEMGKESPRVDAATLPGARRRKLRIGYVSAFLAFRNWMKPVWGTLDAHERGAFEIHLFLDRGLPSRGRGYAPRKSDRIHRLDSLTNEEAARRVAAAGIDILVDLNGYSRPGRLGIFLRRPAPIQIGWYNTFATSGIDAFDYAIADDASLPPAEERFYTERILRVSGSYLAFSVAYPVPDVGAPPFARTGRITFGCLAPQYKINDDVIAAFSRILCAVPGARLLLKNSCMANEGNRAAVLARFLRHGISGDQLLLEGPAEHYTFLKAYGRIDVALDTFPYSGGSTTMEALWQGVPVLTFHGDRWASRTSSSLLLAAGLRDWVRPSRQSYIRRAIELGDSANNGARLTFLRSAMRERLRRSPVCDVVGLCRQLEAHYRAVAESSCAS